MKIKLTFLFFTIFLLTFVKSAVAQNAPIVTDETFVIDEYTGNPDGTVADTSVGIVTASDADDDVLSYSIIEGNTEWAFSISPSGEITVNYEEAVDFEVNPVFTLTIEVTDDEVPPRSGTGTITINLTDIKPQPNDFCTDAVTIGIGETASGSTYEATGDGAIAPDCGSNFTNAESGSMGVWYRMVGNGETITLNTCSGDKYAFDDTSLSVYTGSCTTGLVCVAGNEDAEIAHECGSEGYQARLKFNSEQGVDYFIIVDGFEGARGDFDLTTSSEPTLPPPANDNCQQAEALTVFPEGTGSATEGDNTAANAYNRTSNCSEYANLNDVWYAFNSGPNVSVDVNITLNTAGFLAFALFKSCGGEEIDCNGTGTSGTISLDVEPDTDYLLQLWNSENDKGSFTILINDGPNTAATVASPTLEISRYSPTGTVLELGELADDDQGHAQLFSITNGNDEGIFSIDESTGEVSVADGEALAASATTSFALTVQAEDQGPGSLSGTGTVTLNVIDNAPPAVADKETSLDENSANGTPVINVEASDNDGDNLSYNIVAGNTGSAFAIDNAGEITVSDQNVLDFEINPVFELEVEVTDDGPLNLSTNILVTIALNNVNEAPVVLAATGDISRYSANGYSVGFVDFGDEDEGQNHTFAITAGNTNTIFAIDAISGEITINDETNLNNNGPTTYNLTIEVTDDGNPAETGSATITVNVFDNNAPVITSTSFEVNENAENGTIVGTVIATDADDHGIIFSIEGATVLGAFSISTDGIIEVADYSLLDFESNPSFTLLIQAQDDGVGLLSDLKEIQIDLNDVNEAPVAIPFFMNISSSSPDGFVIGTVEAEDPENDAITFSIADGNDENIFSIDATTGGLTVANGSLLNPDVKPVHTLTVEVTDGSLSSDTKIMLNVYANVLPALTVNTFDIDENSDSGAVLGTLASDDPDSILLLEISGGNDNQLLALNETTWELTIDDASLLDYETNQQFEVMVTLIDGGLGNVQSNEMVTINVIDVNEFTPVLNAIGNQSIDQDVELTFTATATDDDGAPVFTYTLDAASTGKGMSLGASSGVFTWTPSSDHVGTHTVEISVSDGLFSDSETITIEVVEVVGFDDTLKNGFVAYPNPATSKVDLSLENSYQGEVVIRITDLAGQALLTKSIMKSEGKLHSQLDVSGLGAGIYVVELNMKSSKKLVHRLIKE